MASCTWVCATWAQHFTRRYTANRHNTDLHDGKGIIVRILDYLVGRVSGQYLPNDPLEYRRERQKNGTSLDSHNKKKNFWSKVIADSTNDDFFEKSLLFLRELHGTSFDNSTTRRVSLEITYPHGIDPNLSLPKPENKDPAAEQTQAIGNRSVKAISSSGVYTESD